METQKAIALIAEVLDALVGDFVSDCGGNLAEYPVVSSHGSVFYCKACKDYAQCGQLAKAREVNSKLQSLLIDKGYGLNAAYAEGFEDADRGAKLDNPYNSERETDLFAQYNRGYFDGAV